MAAGSIVVDLLMKTGSFETDTKRAEKRAKEMGAEIDKALKIAAGAALAAGAAFAALTKSVINKADETAKAARSIGVTTESLSALGHAAKMSGVSSNELNQALLRLNKGAADGNKAFDAMGISVRDAQGNLKATDTLLKEVSDKFAGYADGAEKSALAQELFGRSGAQMISFLNSGSDGLEAMREEAEKLGIVIDSELAQNAEIFNDNLTKMRDALDGVAIRVANDVLPILIELSNAINDSKEGMSGLEFAAKAIKTVFQTLIVVGSDVAFVFRGIAREIGGTIDQAKALASLDFKNFSDIAENVRQESIKARLELDAFQRRVMGLEVAPDMRAGRGFNRGQADQISPAVAPIVGANQAANTIRKKQEEEYSNWLESFKQSEAKRLYDVQTKRLQDEEAEIQNHANWLMSHEQATQDRLYQIQSQRLAKEEEDAKGYWGRWLEGAENAMMSFDQLAGSVLDNFTKGFGNAFEKMVFDSKKLSDSFKSMAETMLRSIVNALGQMAAQWLTYKAVQMLVGKSTQASAAASQTFQAMAMQQMAALNAFASTAAIPVVGPIAAPAAAGAAFAATSPFVATVASLGAAAVGARATGGPVSADAPYLVGERGPELFVPNTAGKILTNQAISGGGQPVIQQNINVTTGVQQTVRAEIINMMPQIANAAKLAVSDARMRGGSFSSALR
jgi:TP901 family phage tail tape measure protein